MDKKVVFVKGKERPILVFEEDFDVICQYDWYFNHYTDEILAHIDGKIVCLNDLIGRKSWVWRRGAVRKERFGPSKEGRSSRYKGVFWNKKCRLWEVRVGRKRIGFFMTEEEAVKAKSAST